MKGRRHGHHMRRGGSAHELHGGDEPPGAKEGSGKVHKGDMDDVAVYKRGGKTKDHKAKGHREHHKRADRRARGGGIPESHPLSEANKVSGNPKRTGTDKSDD